MTQKKQSRFAGLSILFILLIMTIVSCSNGGGSSIVAPDLTNESGTNRGASANRILWGMWNVNLNPETLSAEIVPLRGVEFTANVTQFMQLPISPTHMVGLTIDPSSDFATGYIVVDVTLQHPFPGLNMYNGFDVRGILFSDGSVSGIYDSTVLRAGPDDTHLQNADGYTRWWNWGEFTSYETIFGATHGKLAPPNQPTATVNAYKYFADGLGAEDAVSDLDPDSRGFFTSSSSNSRRYEIQFKMDSGQIVFDFNYAVDASWDQPAPAFAPDYPVEAFMLSANCQEAFNISVIDAGSTAWYVNGTENGGELMLDIEVFDWQGGANDDVPSEITGLYLEGDVLGGVVDVLSGATVLPGSTINSSIYEVTIGSLDLSGSGNFELFGTVESASPNTYEPQVTGGDAFDYPAAPLAAYFTCTVNVADEAPYPPPSIIDIDPDEGLPACDPVHVTVTGDNFIDGSTDLYLRRDGQPDIVADNVVWIAATTIEADLNLTGALPGLWDVVVETPGGSATLVDGFTVLDVIFVDGDNIGDILEDGTPDHPFNVIQEGLDAANASNDEPVIVDQCANNYDPFTLYDNSHVIGCNWNDGVGWPTVEQTNSFTYGSSVNNATIEGLFFDITINSGDTGIYFNQGDGLKITGCKFSGVVTSQYGNFLRFYRSNNVEISYSEFTEIYHHGSDVFWRAIYVIRNGGTNGVSVHHCEFHDIGYDIPDAGAFGTSLYIIRVGYEGTSPHNVDFHNILVYNIYNKTDCIRPSTNPDPQNALGIFSLSNINSWDWGGDFLLYNITVDDVRHAAPPATTTVNAGHVNGGYFGMIGGDNIDWKNNIVSNVEPTDDWVVYGNTSYYGWWVDGYVNGVPGGQAMDYSLCYNIGKPLPPGENWSSGWNSGWCNQVHEGVGCYSNDEDIDPQYDMTPGANFYHPTNTLISEGADDGGEMGAFGGPEGDWIPPSQL